MPIDALSILCAQLTRDLLAIAKFLFPILTKLGTHDPCTNTEKKLEQIFEILILKFLAVFFNF